MRRRKRAIRLVAVLIQQVNLSRPKFSMQLISLTLTRSGQLRILGSTWKEQLGEVQSAPYFLSGKVRAVC